MPSHLQLAVAIPFLSGGLLLAEWNQWRGPQRNGIADDTASIVTTLPKGDLQPVWESETIPSDHDGGHSSPVVSGGRVYLSVVWHTRVPSESRLIDDEVTGALGYRGLNLLGTELTRKMEEARKALSPRLRGAALDEWARNWVTEHFNAEQKLILGSWTEWRFRQGKNAIDMELLDKVAAREKKPFATAAEFHAWVDAEFPPEARERIIKAVPDTIKVARDTLVCLDAATGKTLWKFDDEGKPTGRDTSGSPTVLNGRVFVTGSTHFYCVDADGGKLLWKRKLNPAGAGSSPLVKDDKVFIMAGKASCLSAADGKELWANPEVKGDMSSPVLWSARNGKSTLVCNARQALFGLDPDTGKKLWQVGGGGQSTPACEGDRLVVYSGSKEVGLRCYQAQPDGPPKTVWSRWWMTPRYSGSPVIHEGHVYLMCGGKHQCVRLDDGTVKWEEAVESTITSPVLVDGKILSVEGNGIFLRLIKADPTSYQMLGRAKIDAMWCPTPAPVNGYIIVRRKDRLASFDLRQK